MPLARWQLAIEADADESEMRALCDAVQSWIDQTWAWGGNPPRLRITELEHEDMPRPATLKEERNWTLVAEFPATPAEAERVRGALYAIPTVSLEGRVTLTTDSK